MSFPVAAEHAHSILLTSVERCELEGVSPVTVRILASYASTTDASASVLVIFRVTRNHRRCSLEVQWNRSIAAYEGEGPVVIK